MLFISRKFNFIFSTALLLFVANFLIKSKPKDCLICRKLIEGDREEILKRRFEVNYSYSGDFIIENCSEFANSRGYFDYPISQTEQENRLAFIIVAYKDLKQLEQLIRSIYRKTNIYCIHVDKKASPSFRRGIEDLASCLDNLFVLNKSYDVKWGEITVLLSEIDCMRSLTADYDVDWKYVINLTGQEFPLKTNLELSIIAKALNGANWIEHLSFLPLYRYFSKILLSNHVPFGLTLYKGPVHTMLSREFVEFVLYNWTAKVFLDWVSDTKIPDETYYATLNYNADILDVPGAFSGVEKIEKSRLHIDHVIFKSGIRYKQWKPNQCYGFYARNICIFGAGDIPLMTKSPSLFANKFHSYYEPEALRCLESWIHHKAYSEIVDFDYHFFRSLDFVH